MTRQCVALQSGYEVDGTVQFAPFVFLFWLFSETLDGFIFINLNNIHMLRATFPRSLFWLLNY